MESRELDDAYLDAPAPRRHRRRRRHDEDSHLGDNVSRGRMQEDSGEEFREEEPRRHRRRYREDEPRRRSRESRVNDPYLDASRPSDGRQDESDKAAHDIEPRRRRRRHRSPVADPYAGAAMPHGQAPEAQSESDDEETRRPSRFSKPNSDEPGRIDRLFPTSANESLSSGSGHLHKGKGFSVMIPEGKEQNVSVICPPGMTMPSLPSLMVPTGEEQNISVMCPPGMAMPPIGTSNIALGASRATPANLPQLAPTPARTLTKLCTYWSGGCKRGNGCWYAHGLEELDRGYRISDDKAPKLATMPMEFASLNLAHRPGQVTKVIKVPKEQVQSLMAERATEILRSVAGAPDVNCDIARCEFKIVGTAQQVDQASQAIQRVTTHCLWGVSAPKIEHLLRPRTDYISAKLTLSPMVPELKKCSCTLSSFKPQLSLGKDPSSGLVIQGKMVSRNHVAIEFNAAKGCLYIVDLSTNGTFLNKRKLPAKGSAKVVLWHGDEIVLQDPAEGDNAEYGYVANVELV